MMNVCLFTLFAYYTVVGWSSGNYPTIWSYVYLSGRPLQREYQKNQRLIASAYFPKYRLSFHVSAPRKLLPAAC